MEYKINCGIYLPSVPVETFLKLISLIRNVARYDYIHVRVKFYFWLSWFEAIVRINGSNRRLRLFNRS